MNRRNFMAVMLAAASAPAFVRYGSLMVPSPGVFINAYGRRMTIEEYAALPLAPRVEVFSVIGNRLLATIPLDAAGCGRLDGFPETARIKAIWTDAFGTQRPTLQGVSDLMCGDALRFSGLTLRPPAA